MILVEVIDVVLMQDGHTVAYKSGVLSKAKKALQVYEKELLANIQALETWKRYLLRANFVVLADHQTPLFLDPN